MCSYEFCDFDIWEMTHIISCQIAQKQNDSVSSSYLFTNCEMNQEK